MKKAINETENIEVLSWREAVRKRPAMYLGSTGIQGFTHLLKEFFASFHKYLDTSNYAFDMPKRIIEADFFSFELTDKQSGIFRLDNLKTRISSNINENLHISGFDFAVLNALSRNYEFTLFDKNKNVILNQVYKQGILKSGKVDEKEYLAESLEVKFDLDKTIWEEFEINPTFISAVIQELAFLNKDKSFEVKYLVNNQPCRNIYNFENGLKEMIDAEKPKGWGSTLFDTYIEQDFEDFSIEAAFAFWNYSVNEPFFKSYVNNHYTHENGTHADAVVLGIIKASKKYVKKYVPEDRFVITRRTVSSFLLAGIHIKIKKPQFWGSTKNKLINKEILKPLSDYIAELLFEKLESDQEKAKDVIRHFAEIHWNKNWLKNFKY